MSAATQRARSAAAVARRLGGSMTFEGASVEAVVMQRVDSWLNDGGSETRDYRYELLIPASEVSAGPAPGDVLVDGSVTYDVIHHGELEEGLWRAVIRPRAG
jgi:hypothetical protein